MPQKPPDKIDSNKMFKTLTKKLLRLFKKRLCHKIKVVN